MPHSSHGWYTGTALTSPTTAPVASALESAHARNTRRVYSGQWKVFADWAAARGVAALPAAPADVAAFLAERAVDRKTATVVMGASAVRAAHHEAGLPDPTADPTVRRALRGIRRQHAENGVGTRQAKALEYDGAVMLLATADRPRPAGRPPGVETPARVARRAVLDRCVVALLFCAGMRRSEVSELLWADVEETAVPGQLRVRVRRSKADQDGARADWRLLVNGFARALADRREAEQPGDGDRVVPLSPGTVARRLAALGRAAGIEGLSGHSGRVGLATELVRRGASTTSVQDAGGWKDPAMVARYAASVRAEDGAVARYLGGNGA